MLIELERQARDRVGRDGTALTVTAESVTPPIRFDGALAQRLAASLGGAGSTPGSTAPLPLLATGAGHDAGILSDAGVPTAMLFVRNPTGVSHSPAETTDDADCLAGVRALTAVLRELA
jgi:N-carbamoyl-L-amino-acid hydrolase